MKTEAATVPEAVPGATGDRRRRNSLRPPSAARARAGQVDLTTVRRRRRAAGRVLGGGDPGRPVGGAPSPSARWIPRSDQLQLLASLLDAGLPLVEALGTLAEMERGTSAQAAFVELERNVRAGSSLGPSLTALCVPTHMRMLIEGGVRTGALATALRSAGALAARIETLRSEVRRAMVYPTVVMTIGLVILAVIAVVVIPPLERTFADLGGELPRSTRIVLAASRPFSSVSSLALVGVVAGCVVLGRRLSGSTGRVSRWALELRIPTIGRRVRRLQDSIRDHLPLSGPLRRELRIAVAANVMATLVRGGVPLDEALSHIADRLESGRAQKAFAAAAVVTREGQSPFEDEALGQVLAVPELAMLRVGERNGLLADQWARVAQRREHALDEQMRRIGVIAEPILVAVMGGIVGGAVLALYLPTFRIIELL